MTVETDKIFEKLDILKDMVTANHTEMIKELSTKPCGVHEEKIHGLRIQINRLWLIYGVVSAAITGAIIKILLT